MNLEIQVSVCIVLLGVVICCLLYAALVEIARIAAEKRKAKVPQKAVISFELKGRGWHE